LGCRPEGYFSIFEEMVELIVPLITHGVQADHNTIPDISLGMAWGKHWVERGYDNDYGPRVSYPQSYPPTFPQARSNPQWEFCYPQEALGVFRRWLQTVYLKDGFPKYLSNQAAQGKITTTVAEAVLSAINPALPPPR